MSNGGVRPPVPALEPAAPGARVTWLELFYDLVFVYAFINVTVTAAVDLTPAALLRGLLMLALLWFAWITFAALGNAVRADQGIMPLVGFVSMAAIFVAAVAIPHAFSERREGLAADLIFASCYLLVRGLQVLAFWYASRQDPELRPRWLALAVPPLISTILLLTAAFAPQLVTTSAAVFATRAVLWALAIAVAYGVAAFTPARGVPIVSAGHWAERYAQVILIALGESIISLGTGPGLQVGLPLTWAIILTAALGIAVIAGLWWGYFDTRAIAGEHELDRAQGGAQVALARDAYTFLHLPMIIGIILFSLGLKRLLADVADPTVPIARPLRGIDLYVLYGGVIVYALALLGFQLRTERWTDWFQATGWLALVALIPVAERIPAVAALAVLALVINGAMVANRARTGGKREQLRRAALERERAVEAVETWWRRRHR